ncbi:MAG: hypothetical protein OSB09_07380 [Planctomycetota bacterium]|nr:hypothetical protein [Planctomycetota bacterium]
MPAAAGRWSVVAELEAGILRLPVARIDNREVLLETTIRLRTGNRFELIVERPDGHAELIHAEVLSRTSAGVLLRWKPAHPRELDALERLFSGIPTTEGHADLESALRSRSRLVRTAAIAAQRDSVRVLNLSAIKDLIQTAVEDVLRESGHTLEETEMKRLLEESEKGFREKLTHFENEKADLQSHMQGLSGKLDRAQKLLGREKNRAVEREQFSLSEGAMIELESKLGSVIDAAVESGTVTSPLEAELREAMERSLDSERERAREQEEQVRSENIQLLERKIHRLAHSLDDARIERDLARESARRAEARDQAPGFKGPAGPRVEASSGDDPDQGLRRALLLELVQENKELRSKISATKENSQ